jgi:hypothetical protein
MARSQNQGGRTREAAPNGPTDLSGGSWRVAAKRTLKDTKTTICRTARPADKLRNAAPGRDK